jgi:hypothetical protein
MKAAVVFDLAEGPVWADFIDRSPRPARRSLTSAPPR